MKTGKQRNFFALLGLSFITGGIYYYYWLYVNIKEIKESFLFEAHEKQPVLAKILLFGVILATLLMIVASVFALLAQQTLNGGTASTPLYWVALYFISTAVSAAFFYVFTQTVALGQMKAKLPEFSILKVYILIVVGLALSLLGNFIPATAAGAAGFAGGICYLIYLYAIQKQINRIWAEEGEQAPT